MKSPTSYILKRVQKKGVQNEEHLLQIQLLTNASFVGGIAAAFYVIVTFIFSFKQGQFIMSSTGAMAASVPLLFLLTSNVRIVGNVLLTVGCYCWIALVTYTGGIYSPVLPYFTILPVAANLFIDRLHAWIWLGISLACISGFFVYNLLIGASPIGYNQELELWYFYVVSVGVVILVILFTILFDDAKLEAEQKVVSINETLYGKNQEITTQNEELTQLAEELLTQQEFIEEKNKELENKNHLIGKSIKSAETIQQAVLPVKSDFLTYFQEAFILNRPKDIVSGDFFWFTRIDQKIILVVADCTGHGVSGAFVTLICKTLLDKIVQVKKITQPSQILTNLNLEIFEALKQETSGNVDGMDGVVMTFDLDENDKPFMLTYSGAKSSIFVSDKGDIEEFKGDRIHVGGFNIRKKKDFTDKQIPLLEGDIIYAGSDGLQDQNNDKKKKFSKKRIIHLLSSNFELPLEHQNKKLQQELDLFMKKEEQRDDILWVGVKI